MQDNSVLILYPPIKTDNILVTCISKFQMQYYLVQCKIYHSRYY